MKTATSSKWIICLALAILPLAGRGEPDSATSASAAVSTAQPAIADAAAITNAASPEEAERNLENAPGQVLSTLKPPANVRLSATAEEVVKLSQAGVDESVMMAYVTNSIYTFKLTSDDIIYLNDLGVPSSVVTAMLQRDEGLKTSAAMLAGGPPGYSNQTASIPGAPMAYPGPRAAAEMELAQPPADEAMPYAEPQPQVNVSYTYFYDSLAPYGNWIDVGGYGPCWRPAATVVNPNWRPYCDRGHWTYSDCGWYWASDYSWGWAPFHYGRWFNHSQWGWCWAPDTVWGPSWVSWRYSPNYCGWAPLPPTACWTPGFGFSYYGNSVGFNFGFGLSSSCFTFVPSYYFCDRSPWQHTVPRHSVAQVYQQTVAINEVMPAKDRRAFNRGIPVGDIAAATRTTIHPLPIRDVEGPTAHRRDRNESSRTIAAYRPDFPQPAGNVALAGQGVPASPRPVRGIGRVQADPNHAGRSPVSPGTRNTGVIANRFPAPAREEVRPEVATINPPGAPAQRSAPFVLHGSGRIAYPSQPRDVAGSRNWSQPGANNLNPSPAVDSTSPQPAPPAFSQGRNNNSSVTIASPQRRFSPTAPQQNQSPAPGAPVQTQRSTRWQAPPSLQQQPRSYPQYQPAAVAPRQPALSLPSQPSTPTAPHQSPRAAERRDSPSANPAAQRSAPAPSPAPRVDARTAPAPSTPAPQSAAPVYNQGGGRNGRQ